VLSHTPVRDYTRIPLEGRRLLVPQLIPGTLVKREIVTALRMASAAFKEAGLNVIEEVKLPVFKLAFEIMAIIHRDLFPLLRRELGGGRPIRLLPELLATRGGQGRVGSAVLAITSIFSLIGPAVRLAGYGRLERIDELRTHILDLMGEGGLMLWPVYASPAPRHGFAWGPYGMPSYTVGMNALGFPAVALPVAWSDEGLPLGVQVIGRPDDDEVALAAAAVLERAYGGWRLAAL
jgi:fatty acid amide hydrolase 2